MGGCLLDLYPRLNFSQLPEKSNLNPAGRQCCANLTKVKEIEMLEGGDYRGLLRGSDLKQAVLPARYAYRNRQIAKQRSKQPLASSQLNSWQDAAVSRQEMRAAAEF
jgi:hypothetical protein